MYACIPLKAAAILSRDMTIVSCSVSCASVAFAHWMAALKNHDALLPGEFLALVSTSQKHSYIIILRKAEYGGRYWIWNPCGKSASEARTCARIVMKQTSCPGLQRRYTSSRMWLKRSAVIPTYDPTRLCSSTAGSSPPRRTAIFVYAVHHVSMLHPSTVPGRLAISYVAFP